MTTPQDTKPHIADRSNLKEDVAAYIRELILSGTLRPNSKVDQEKISEEVGVSRLPVREALIQLASEGLVVTVPRRGVYVAALEPSDVYDHYQIYGLICGVAAARAAVRLTEDELVELEELVVRMDQESDQAVLEELNIEFHRRINRAGGSGRLRSVLRMLAASLPTTFYEFATGWADAARAHHWEILRALKERDAPRAAQTVRDHLQEGSQFAVETLRARGFWTAEEYADFAPDDSFVQIESSTTP